MELTTDESLIRSILEDESVIDGFSDGKPVDDLTDAYFFYEEGVGIFPVRINNGVVDIHAAIPKKNRGKKALEAAKSISNILTLSGYTVTARVRYNDKKTRCFINMVGFHLTGSNDQYQMYRYM